MVGRTTAYPLPPGDALNSGDVAWMLTASGLVLHDAWAVVLLRRHGQFQERCLDHAAKRDRAGRDQPGLGLRGLWGGVRPRRRRLGIDRQPALLLHVRQCE